MSVALEAPPVAPFESASELKEMHARLLEALDRELAPDASSAGEQAAVTRLEPEIRRFLARGSATGVYLEEVRERTACQVLLDYWVSSLAQARLPAGSARLARFDDQQLPDLKDKPCPYVGLEAFRAQDHALFFGRESDTRALLAQVRESPLVVVLGSSGSGKSSLVMGGVLPALAAEGEPALRIVAPFVPGNAVLDHLVAAVLASRGGPDAPPAEEIAAEAAALREDPRRLLELLGGAGAPALLTIDQFEEIFTLASAAERETLAASLAGLLEAARGHRVILTVREEFRSRIVELRALSPYLDRAWCSMRPMDYDELRAAVERPAALVNLQFQAGIVDDLVKKVLGQPAALPLLQFTLRLLWERRDRNRITWEVYNRTGDPLNALKASADRFYDGLAPETQQEVRRVLLELVRVDDLLEAYRQPVPRARLLQAGRASTAEVLALLAKSDYIRISADAAAADAIVEVKHESLVRNWPRFVGWIDEKRIERRQRLLLSQAARRWADSGKPADGLLTGWQLEEAKSHADLSALERDLLAASVAAVERTQREREAILRRKAEQARALAAANRKLLHRTTAALVVVVVAALAIGGAAVHFWQKAQALDREAQRLQRQAQIQTREATALKYRAASLDRTRKETEQKLAKVRADYDAVLAERVQLAVAPGQRESPGRPVTIYLHISTDAQRRRAQEIARLLQQKGIKVPEIQRVRGMTRSSVRYFRPEDQPEAEQIAQLLNEYLAAVVPIRAQLTRGYEQRVPGQQYEIWFAPDALRPKGGPSWVKLTPMDAFLLFNPDISLEVPINKMLPDERSKLLPELREFLETEAGRNLPADFFDRNGALTIPELFDLVMKQR